METYVMPWWVARAECPICGAWRSADRLFCPPCDGLVSKTCLTIQGLQLDGEFALYFELTLANYLPAMFLENIDN